MTSPAQPSNGPQDPPWPMEISPGQRALPPLTSGAATASLVISILSALCVLPLIGGIIGTAFGIFGLIDIKKSEGRKGGGGLAWLGIAIGGFTALTQWGILLAVIIAAAKSPSTPAPISIPTFSPPTLSPTPSPTPSPPEERLSFDDKTAELAIGKMVVVDVGSEVASLETELRAQRGKAAKENQKLILQTTAPSCRPCLGVAAALTDPRMQQALSGIRLVRVNVHEFGEDLAPLLIPHEVIPGFYLLGPNIRPSDGIDGGEWDEDTAENIAPVLKDFVAGKYTRRRKPWRSPIAPPSPQSTIL